MNKFINSNHIGNNHLSSPDFMKKLLLILIITLLTNCLYAQKNGYEEIHINSKLADLQTLKKYKIFADTTEKNTWIVKGDSLRIFMTDIDRIELNVNKKGVIKRITAYSKPLHFNDYSLWSSYLADLYNYVDTDVRHKGSEYYEHNPQDQAKVWVIKEAKTALFFKTAKPEHLSKDFVGTYIFWWVEDKNGTADITY
jgi:hypothetical protein